MCKCPERRGIPSGLRAKAGTDTEWRVYKGREGPGIRSGGRKWPEGRAQMTATEARQRMLEPEAFASHESGERRDSSAGVGVASADGVKGFCALWGARRFPL